MDIHVETLGIPFVGGRLICSTIHSAFPVCSYTGAQGFGTFQPLSSTRPRCFLTASAQGGPWMSACACAPEGLPQACDLLRQNNETIKQ